MVQKVRRRRAGRRVNKLITHNLGASILFNAAVKSMRNIPVVCDIMAYIPHRYHFVNENKTWREAQTYCRVKYTDLATINNMGEMKKLNYTLMKENAKKAWIGLQRERPGKWKWSDQSNSSFRYWSSDKHSGGLNCTAVSESEQRYWSDENCTEKLPFICHENKLILINETLTWKEALRYCRNCHHDLVSMFTEEIQLWVKEVAQNASTEHVCLGLLHTCALGFWYWVNGEMICYQNWAPGNRTGFKDYSHEERTGAVQSGGEQKWLSLPQSKKLNFSCSTYEFKCVSGIEEILEVFLPPSDNIPS
ncbi:hypothetical protein QTP86_009369 [Hemibagrus guttatus]|nr:hypothetical protein QTP86_009369 [Hemibagrus guttatus]